MLLDLLRHHVRGGKAGTARGGGAEREAAAADTASPAARARVVVAVSRVLVKLLCASSSKLAGRALRLLASSAGPVNARSGYKRVLEYLSRYGIR